MSNVQIYVCSGRTRCSKRGGDEIAKQMRAVVAERGLEKVVEIREEGCLGLCSTGPSVFVNPGWHQYGRVAIADCKELVTSHAINKEPVERLLINSKNRK